MTSRDEEILRLLCYNVRLFSLEQVARTWWAKRPREIRRARRRMLALADDGWLVPAFVLARPLLKLVGPMLEWRPANPVPDFRAISKKLRSRWKEPARQVEVYVGSQHAAGVFGGRSAGVVKNLCQTTHDLHVSEVFLFYREQRPDLATMWIGEDRLAEGTSKKRPDAVLQTDSGLTLRVVEFGGAYRADRIEDLHSYCVEQNLPFELW